MTTSPFASFHTRLSSRKRALVAMAWGALAVLALPPFNLFPLLLFSLPAFFFLIQGTKNARSAFYTGWSFGFGFFVCGLYWIAGALFVDIKTFWWVLPLAVAGLPSIMALYYGAACALVRRYLDLSRIEGWVGFGLSLFAAEWARGHWFTGFPWNLLGYAWGDWLPWLQGASLVGIYGLTFVTIFLFLTPAVFALSHFSKRQARRMMLGACVIFVAWGVWGQARLSMTETTFVPNVKLRLVQPALDQKLKWDTDKRVSNFQDLLVLSFGDGADAITHVIWPETATAFLLNEAVDRRMEIISLLPTHTTLITGTVQRALNKESEWDFFNSMISMDKSGYITSGYDKAHLVPFGEYIPFRSLLPKAFAAVVGVNFKPGDGAATIKLKDFPAFSPLVCYEAIFSGEVARRDDRPGVLINVTNDAWYKGTIGPYQHFSNVRVRAIEEGAALIRVSNMGISAVTDPLGRIHAQTQISAPEVIDSFLPDNLNHNTVFILYGNVLIEIVFVFMMFFVIIARRKHLLVE